MLPFPPQNKEKEEGEKEDDKQGKTGVKRGRPPMRTTPPSAGRSVSKTPSNEGRSNSKSSRLSDTSSLPNGEGEPGRTPVMWQGLWAGALARQDPCDVAGALGRGSGQAGHP